MAAKTPDTVKGSQLLGYGIGQAAAQDADVQGYVGRRHIVLSFITESLDNADTIDPDLGPNSVIVSAAWESETDEVYITVTSATRLTATCASGGSNGYVHIWVSG